jgi:hypothetical protein
MRITSLFEDEDDLHLFGQIALSLGLPLHAVSEKVLIVSEARLGTFAPWLHRALG